MAEYIKREEVYQYLDNEVEWNVNQDRLYTLEVISDFPAADVAEVRHGRWIAVCGESSGLNWKCSLCAKRVLQKSPYCPNCGALMKEEEHEAD
jgi:hypothetical protein